MRLTVAHRRELPSGGAVRCAQLGTSLWIVDGRGTPAATRPPKSPESSVARPTVGLVTSSLQHGSRSARPPEVEVRRSARRRRTVSAYRDGGRVVVLIPARFTKAEEAKWVEFQKIEWTDQEGKQRLWEAANRKTRGKSGIDAVAIAPILLHPSNTPK